MNLFSKLRRLAQRIKDNPLFSFLIGLLILTFGTFVGVLFFGCIETYLSKLLGLSNKNETLKFLGISMGGILIALQALMSYKRAKAMEDTAQAQADAANAQARATEEQTKANQHTEQGQRQERFRGEKEYQEKYKSKPSEEIQSLLNLLFVQEHEIFKGCHINLQGSWLKGVDLKRARLENAILVGVQLQGAVLLGVKMQGADLSDSELQGATLQAVQLQGATLQGVKMQGTTTIGSGESFEERIKRQIYRESELTSVIFEGKLSQEVLDSIIAYFSDSDEEDEAEREVLRARLMPHVGKPESYELPENSGAITGTYTEEDAEKWIAEHNEAMSSFPKEDTN